MNHKRFTRKEVLIFATVLIAWAISYLVVFGACIVGSAFCGGLIIGYLKLGKGAEIYFLWVSIIISTLVIIALFRWDDRRRFRIRSAEAAVTYFRRKHANDA
jgi:hypothetical protein